MTRIHVLFIPSSYRSASSCDFSFLILLLLLFRCCFLVVFSCDCTRLTTCEEGTWSVLENIKNIHFRNCFAQWQTWQLKVKNNVNFFRSLLLFLPSMCHANVIVVSLRCEHFLRCCQYREIADRQGKRERRWQHLTHNNCGMMDHWDKMINDWRQAENLW